ncbi:MAG: hypothetical protein ISR74_04610 [Candidatus Thioglobus sp.]|nr:hypothetical protein [Candidatus Thioglobus pontius]MBL6984867.1 hypothetical protein [Candidatus Thioglobus sp.]
MKKTLATILLLLHLPTHSLSPNEMLVIIGAVKYYNENCAGLTPKGMHQMNKGLKRFDMDSTPLFILEQNKMAVSGFKTAEKFGCNGTQQEAQKAGYGQYIN